MKREQEIGDSQHRAQKFLKMDLASIKDLLFALPDDEFKLVLGHLNKDDKGNLKMASKDYEKKVMRLDPKMRSWNMRFNSYNWKEVGMTLSDARIRHTLDGTIQDIKLSVEFINDVEDDSHTMVLISDSVINHWKNNIVYLSLKITGLESFLLDPALKMTQLKSLEIINLNLCDESYTKDPSEIISVLLEKHQDNLVKLSLWKELPNISTQLDLNLKELKVAYISSKSFVYLLKTSIATLENVTVSNIPYVCEEDISQVESMKLQIKQLEVYKNSNSRLIASLVKSSCSTLKNLVVNEMRNSSQFDLGAVQLKLTSFSASLVPPSIIITIISATQSSLKDFKIDSYSFSEDELRSFQSFNQLNLKTISAGHIKISLLSALLHCSRTSLEDLSLVSIRISNEPDGDQLLSQLNQMQLSRLKKFSSIDNLKDLTIALINSSQASLQCLEVNEYGRTSSTGEQIQLNHEGLQQLKIFKCEQTPFTVAVSIINSSLSTLENLELGSINKIQDDEVHFNSPLVALKTLSCCRTPPTFVNSIIDSANSTLEHLQLERIDTMDDKRFDLEQGLFKLKSFMGRRIPSSIVRSVLKSSPTLFNRVELKKIGMKETNQFDSETTKLLIHVKSQNPNCILDI